MLSFSAQVGHLHEPNALTCVQVWASLAGGANFQKTHFPEDVVNCEHSPARVSHCQKSGLFKASQPGYNYTFPDPFFV